MKIAKLKYEVSEKIILDNLNFKIEFNKVNIIVGPNGAGKTTLLEILAGIKHTENESVLKLICNYNVLLLNQEFLVFNELTANEFIDFVCKINKISRKEKQMFIDKSKKLNLDFFNTRIKNLSLGQSQKLLFLVSLLSNLDIILLDEPFNGLDRKSTEHLIEIIREIKREKTFILSTHYLDSLDDYADNCIIMGKGEIKKQVFTDDKEVNFEDIIKKEINL